MKKSYTPLKCYFFLTLFLLFKLQMFAQPGSAFTHVATTGISAGSVDNTAIAVSKADNKMYVAYRDNANSGKLSVMQYNGSTWSLLGSAGISAGAVNFALSIATISTINGNEVYVAYSDAVNNNKLTIMRWGGLGWSTDGSAGSHSSGDVSSVNIIAANNGDLFVAYTDAASSSKVFVKKRVSGSWTNISGTGISAGAAEDIDIACGNDHLPYVVYKDVNANNKATVRKYNGTSWTNVGTAGFTVGSVSDCSIEIDRLNRPCIAYADGNASNKISVRYFDGTSWQALGNLGFSSNAVAYTSIVFDYDNNAFVVYRDNAVSNKVTVRKYNGNSWSNVQSPGFSAGAVDYTSIVFDNDQSIYIAYKDAGITKQAVVQQLTCTLPSVPTVTSIPSGFTICASDGLLLNTNSQLNTSYAWYQKLAAFEDVGTLGELNDNSNNSGAAFSSTTDANGNIFVVKMQTADSNIVVKRFAGGVWSTIGGVVGKSAGQTNIDATDIAFDKDGNLYVAYIDNAGAMPVVVKKFVSGSWVNVGPTVTEACIGAALHINSYGVICLATGKKNGFDYLPTVYVDYGTGWETLPSINNTENIGNIDVTISKTGTILMSYNYNSFKSSLYNSGLPRAYKYNGVSWVNLNIGLTEQSYFTHILSDNNNNFYVSTNSLAPASAVNDYKVYVLKSTNEGNSWTNIGPTNFWNTASRGNSLAMDKNGVLYIGYSTVVSGVSKYKLSKYVASNWVDLFTPLENATNAQMQIFFDNNNVPYLTEYQIAANINKANVYRIESRFLSSGGTRYTQSGGDYFLTVSAGCGIDVVSATATVIQTSATNNWTGNSNTEFNNSNNWSCGRIPNSTDDVLIPSGAPRYPILSATNSSNVIIKSLTIGNGATLTVNGQSLSLSADLNIGSGNLDMSVANSKLVMNGTTKQLITGGPFALNNVTINNSSNVEITDPIASILGTLEFVNGKLITSGILLTGNIIGFNSNRFVVLPSSNSTNQLLQNIDAGEMKFFPIGNSETSYTPVIISHTANSQRSARIKVYDGLSAMPGTDTSSYVNKKFRFLGDLNTDYNFTFQWNTVDENSAFLRNSCGIITRPSMNNSPFNINTAIDQTGGAAATVVSGNTFSRTINNVQTINTGSTIIVYKDFNITSAPSLLPIQLLSFTAKLMSNKSVAIDWKISATSNPKEFVIEKSNDGILFKSLTTITANNNLHYQYIDGQLAENGKQLYRLKMIDLDGKISYSAIVQVFIPTVNVQIVAIFPSPVQSTNATMTVYAPTNQVYTFIVTDILGKQVQTLQSALTKGENLIQLPTSQLSKGVFFVTGYNQLGKTNSIKIVKD